MVSPDSIVPSPTNPQSFNRYTYSLNNPVNLVDPTGHRTCTADEAAKDFETCNQKIVDFFPQPVDDSINNGNGILYYYETPLALYLGTSSFEDPYWTAVQYRFNDLYQVHVVRALETHVIDSFGDEPVEMTLWLIAQGMVEADINASGYNPQFLLESYQVADSWAEGGGYAVIAGATSFRPDRYIRVGDLRPAHSRSVGDRGRFSNLSDKELLDLVVDPPEGEVMTIFAHNGKMAQGNGRAYELLRRAADPRSSITEDTLIPVLIHYR